MSDNLTLGRGEIHFGQFVAGSQTPRGERYFGNTPEFNISTAQQNLDHFSSDRGVREKDGTVLLQVDRTATLVTDEINPENLALFFTGANTLQSVVGATVTDEAIAAVEQGLYYQLGVSTLNPAGVRGLTEHTVGSNVIVKVGVATKVAGTDYVIDMDLGRLYIVPGGGIASAAALLVSYKTSTHTREVIVSGSVAIEGSLRYIAFNPAGKNRDVFIPWVKITPNGDFTLKTGDNWATLPFSVEILKKTGLEAIYVNGRAIV